MSRRGKGPAHPESALETTGASVFLSPSSGSLAALAALGALAALASTVLWGELWLARATGSAVCSFGDTGCATLWDSKFARGVHDLSGVPVAGFGLAWGLVAAALPLLRLGWGEAHRLSTTLVSAIRLSALTGAASIAALALVSAGLGRLCLGCAGVYVIVGGYAGIALAGWPGVGWRSKAQGAGVFASVSLLALLLLVPVGKATPRPLAAEGQASIGAPSRAAAAGSDDVSRMLPELTPPQAQTLSDSLGLLRRSAPVQPPAPRAVIGAADAPVRILAWSDIRCPHCAELHETLKLLLESYPGRVSVEQKWFPLDGACNSAVRETTDRVRCLVARAALCAEGRSEALAFAGELFAEQEGLTEARVRERIQSRFGPGLDACLAGRDVDERLDDDIQSALRQGIEGTPLVLVNGRRGVSFPPFLEAMVLAAGNPDHPAFAALPPPDPKAHLH